MHDPGIAQICAHVPGLGERVYAFLSSFSSEDYDGCLLLTHPKLFEVVPKELVRQQLYKTFHGEDAEINIDLFSIDQVGRLIDHRKGQYVRIDYTSLFAMKFKENMESGSGSKKGATKKKRFMLDALKAQYGKDNIWYEETTRSYCFYVKSSMVAIKDNVSPQWTFITFKKHPMMEKFLPKDILIIFDAGSEDG